MKPSPLQRLSVILISFVLIFAPPVFGDDTADMLAKALDLVHHVENPTGNPPTDAQRIDLLTQAITMAQQAPNHRLKGHRVLAIQALRSAIAEIRAGDPNQQAATYLHTADTELSISVSLTDAANAKTTNPTSTANPTTPPPPTSTSSGASDEMAQAVQNDDLDKVKALIKADPTLISSTGGGEYAPLVAAAAHNDTDVVEFLLASKADVNVRNEAGMTALYCAVQGGFADVADLLIAHGADLNARNKLGQTPLYEAMFQVPWRKDMAALLLAHGADPNIGDNEGATPLHLAVGWIRPDKAEFLLGYKVDVNAREKNGDTPLYVAISYRGRDDIAQVLLAHGADPTLKGHDGLTPRELALKQGDADMAAILANPAATLGPPPAPVDGVAPPELIARFMTDLAKKPPGPLENDVTEEVVQMMKGMAQLTKTKISPREAAAAGFGIFTLEGPVTEFYAQGLAAIYEGKATLTESAAKNFQDDYDQSSATWTDKGKTVTDKGPFFGFGPGIADFTDAKIPADRRVLVSFCLVQQHSRWKVHCLYFSNAPLAGDHKDFVVQQLAAFSRKQGG